MQLLTSAVPASRVVIDCSRLFGDAEHDPDAEAASLLAWVRSHPRRSDIRVVLGGDRGRHASRRLQGALQALGCVVTARHAAYAG
jgi:hypothetical protein